jgi:hypothetical protein
MRFFPVAVLLGAIVSSPSLPAQDKAAEHIKVEVKGKLETGIIAIGGETTGTTITANGVTWELDVGKNAKLRKLLPSLDGKTVVAKGTLSRRAGVETGQRWIVNVSSLEAVK